LFNQKLSLTFKPELVQLKIAFNVSTKPGLIENIAFNSLHVGGHFSGPIIES